jgi:hypothetical protein
MIEANGFSQEDAADEIFVEEILLFESFVERAHCEQSKSDEVTSLVTPDSNIDST